MSREVRRVPASWQHPRSRPGRYRPLFESSYDESIREWTGDRDNYDSERNWLRDKPRRDDYMPDWPEEEKTHWQMYETTSEGTPISPVMESPEALARWLADNNVSTFASMTATYQQWLDMIKAGWAPSAVADSSGMRSGVEFMSEKEKN